MIIEMEPSVNDICAVITAVTAFHPGDEIKLLEKVQAAITDRIKELQPAAEKSNDTPQ
ncbi:hypothetical protein D3C73_1329880 [compost metagenome]